MEYKNFCLKSYNELYVIVWAIHGTMKVTSLHRWWKPQKKNCTFEIQDKA